MQISNCPFCGGDGKLVHIPPTNSVQSDEYRVECGDCGSCGRACDDSDRAVYYWNHREFQQETFQQAVINDPDMTYEQKKYWLSQKPPNKGLQSDDGDSPVETELSNDELDDDYQLWSNL